MGISKKEIIEKCIEIRNEENACVFASKLEEMIEKIEEEKDRVSKLRHLRRFMTDEFWKVFDKSNGVLVFNEKESPFMNLAFYLVNKKASSVSSIRKITNRVIDEYKTKYIPPKSSIISLEEIRRVLSISNKKMKLLDFLIKKNILHILIFNHSNKEFSSVFELYHNNYSIIRLFSISSADIHPVFVFLHELGHRFHFNLTGDTSIIPNGFIEIVNSLNLKADYDLSELFANFFAVAVMHNTEFHQCSPFLGGRIEEMGERIEEYYMRLISGE
jgi:Zn-dependent peptidase ImmA (M78 family)